MTKYLFMPGQFHVSQKSNLKTKQFIFYSKLRMFETRLLIMIKNIFQKLQKKLNETVESVYPEILKSLAGETI